MGDPLPVFRPFCQQLFDFVSRLFYPQAVIFILTGAVGSGKTAILKALTSSLRGAAIAFDGFLSLRVMENERRVGYDLLDLKGDRSEPFLRVNGKPEGQCVGSYSVLPQGLALAERIINRSRAADLLIVDEIGPLELAGKGLWPALREAMKNVRRRFCVVVREGLVDDVRGLFPGHEIEIMECGENALPALMAAIRKP